MLWYGHFALRVESWYFHVLTVRQNRSFTLYSAAADERKWRHLQDISHP